MVNTPTIMAGMAGVLGGALVGFYFQVVLDTYLDLVLLFSVV
jgi:hypothetical protein